MKKHIFVILVLAVLAGCSRDASTTNSNSAFIDVSNPKELPSSEIIESVDFLFLNETDDIMIGDVSDLCYVDELWYILDISDRGSVISTFDKEGNALHTMNRTGRGPGEYLSINNFDVCPKTGDVYAACMPAKVLVFDKDLNLKQEIPINLTENSYLLSVAKLDDGIMLHNLNYKTDGTSFMEVYYMALDENKTSESQLIKSWKRDNCSEIYSNDAFMRSDKNIYFATVDCDTLYRVDAHDLTAVTLIDYPNREQIREFRNSDSYVLEEDGNYIVQRHKLYTLPESERTKYYTPRIHHVMERGDELWLHYSHLLYGYNVITNDGSTNYSAKKLAASIYLGDSAVVVADSFRYDNFLSPETFDPSGWLKDIPVNYISLTDKQIESGNKILVIYNLKK